MSSLMDVLVTIAPVHDSELMDGYQRYVTLLATLLSPAQLDTYAALIHRTGTVRVFDEMTPDELAEMTPDEAVIATTVMADATTALENRRVVALLNQRGQHAVAPDLGSLIAGA